MVRNGQEPTETLLSTGIKAAAEAILGIWQAPLPTGLADLLPVHWPYPRQSVEVVAFRPWARVIVLEDDEDAAQLVAREADQPEQNLRIQYHIADRNELFTPSVQLMRQVTGFPVHLHLLDIEIDGEGVWRPKGWVLEPDFLIDVTAVAESFHGKTTHPWGYLLKKFLPYDQTPALMLGNIANFFLDALMNKPETTFQELAARVFSLNPLAFCLFNDRDVREMMQKAQGHFLRIKQMVTAGFKEEGMQYDHAYLEPAFYSQQYGLQGRLDLLFRAQDASGRTSIVELKSGKPFMPNLHGLSPSHYIQTILYDLLVRSAYGSQANIGCYILYSGEMEKPLRFAPAIKAQQYEAIQVRNHLLAIEYLLAQLGTEGEDLLAPTQRLFMRLDPERHPDIKGFAEKGMSRFIRVFQNLDPEEQRYFGAFAGFVAREHLLAKTGVQGVEQINGLASLWLDHPDDKEQNYQRLAGLSIVRNETTADEPVLVFQRSEKTNPLANFRVGDIAVLFPFTEDGVGVLQHQVFKCTITHLNAQEVGVRLRSTQFNDLVFRAQTTWTIEHDLLDSSINAYYQGLFEWAGSLPRQRRLLLGLRPPTQRDVTPRQWPNGPTVEQQRLLDAMLSAEEYYLLWGPPGTGKTSVVLHHLVRHLLEHTQENILLLAYTNRAVDEICEAIEQIGEEVCEQYLRIGSNYGTHARFQPRLLQNAILQTTTRQQLKSLISGKRIFVGTVAALANRQELFQLKSFDRVIIDEASQILEPVLVGLLPKFPKWILIGDHRQLPAVVAQDERLARVQDPALLAVGITHLGQSLFERLYLKCQQEEWHWAFGQLTHQGRMHQDIMAFPARFFYHQQLSCLPEEAGAFAYQQQPLQWKLPADANILEQQLANRRMLFIPTPVDEESATLKTNHHEARLVVDMIKAFQRMADYNGEPLRAGAIGVITPYRAQIAQIRALMETEGLSPDDFTVDTVERYQGGARDIVLISLCTNAPRQIQQLSILTDEQVDRKLNVAITRARNHLVIIGNPELLALSPIYRELMDFLS
ncbi:MAG: AAA domain-containing protein [Saprospiraceae bacterium]